MRVRAVLDSLDTSQKASLKKLLPPATQTKLPEVETQRYPSAFLTALNVREKYSILGCVAEELLANDITPSNLISTTKKYIPLTPLQESKILSSKTTQPFLDALLETQAKLRAVVKGDLQYNTELQGTNVEGHPDIKTKTQIFEVKLTGQLKENWQYFLFQVFSYAALAPEAEDIYLVLPLQKSLWHFNTKSWKHRAAFKNFLEEAAKGLPGKAISLQQGLLLMEFYRIGTHLLKLKSLPLTIQNFPSYTKPYQIFLSNPQSTKLSIPEEDLTLSSAIIQATSAKLFIHSPYIINLCYEPGTQDDYHLTLLKKNLEYGVKVGAKGVVVHVGKSTDKPLEKALEYMLHNIQAALEAATETCPLLLETPAGQGSEVLTKYEEFVDFVRIIDDPRLRICVDTCHIFACGHEPLSYLDRILSSKDKSLLHLIHFNDSSTPCGSCVDRHAFIGAGHIGIEKMSKVAELCDSHGVPMLYE
jgi:deoxyribonuclease-4